MSNNFDALGELDRLMDRQKGLPGEQKKEIATEEEILEEKPQDSSPETTENELKKKQSSFSTKDTVKEEDTELSQYKFVPDKTAKMDFEKNEVDFEGSVDETIDQNINKEDETKLKKLKRTSSKVIVSQGDKLQATFATVIYDWRGEKGLEQAQQHQDLLIKKITELGSLDESEKLALKYARDYIRKCELRKEEFEKGIHLSDEDKEEIIELLGDYLEVASVQISPLWIIAGIVAITLFTNLYTAFTAHPKYNPPI